MVIFDEVDEDDEDEDDDDDDDDGDDDDEDDDDDDEDEDDEDGGDDNVDDDDDDNIEVVPVICLRFFFFFFFFFSSPSLTAAVTIPFTTFFTKSLRRIKNLNRDDGSFKRRLKDGRVCAWMNGIRSFLILEERPTPVKNSLRVHTQ